MSKPQLAFFVVVYGSPFIALFAAETYNTLYVPHVSFLNLLVDVLVIAGTYLTILVAYRQNQGRIQRWRIERAARKQAQLLNTGVPKEP